MPQSPRQRKLREKVVERDGPNCHWCGKKLKEDEQTLEHIIRKADGGTDALENLAIACAPCNNDRHYTTKPGNRNRNRPNPRQRKAKRRREQQKKESPLSVIWVYTSESDQWTERKVGW